MKVPDDSVSDDTTSSAIPPVLPIIKTSQESKTPATDSVIPPTRPSGTVHATDKEGSPAGKTALIIGVLLFVCVTLSIFVAAFAYKEWTGGTEVSQTKVRKEIFNEVYRVSVELQSGQEIGINREGYGALLKKFATELTLLKNKIESDEEQEVFSGYSELLSIYKDAAKVWDVKLDIPNMEQFYKQRVIDADILKPFREKELRSFSRVCIRGIPLNSRLPELVDHRLLEQEGFSTGLDVIASRYQLPIYDIIDPKTIPHDSMQLIWLKASEKSEEVHQLQNQ